MRTERPRRRTARRSAALRAMDKGAARSDIPRQFQLRASWKPEQRPKMSRSYTRSTVGKGSIRWCAGVMAKRGKKVLVERDVLGGCIRTEAPLRPPAFCTTPCPPPTRCSSPARYAELKDQLHANGLRLRQQRGPTGVLHRWPLAGDK